MPLLHGLIGGAVHERFSTCLDIIALRVLNKVNVVLQDTTKGRLPRFFPWQGRAYVCYTTAFRTRDPPLFSWDT
jgi:hypothetical protein